MNDNTLTILILALRNMLRKAKMAKVLAILEVPDEIPAAGYSNTGKSNDTPLVAADPARDGAKQALSTLRYISSYCIGPVSRTLGGITRSYTRSIGGIGTFQ